MLIRIIARGKNNFFEVFFQERIIVWMFWSWSYLSPSMSFEKSSSHTRIEMFLRNSLFMSPMEYFLCQKYSTNCLIKEGGKKLCFISQTHVSISSSPSSFLSEKCRQSFMTTEMPYLSYISYCETCEGCNDFCCESFFSTHNTLETLRFMDIITEDQSTPCLFDNVIWESTCSHVLYYIHSFLNARWYKNTIF